MNIRSRKWKIGAAIFAAVNVAGAVYAARLGEGGHAATHGALLLLVVVLYLTLRGGSRTPRHDATATPAPDEAIRNLEQSLEDIALNVERIGEAQRFHAKVLEERARPQ